jgi:hypothetical protein
MAHIQLEKRQKIPSRYLIIGKFEELQCDKRNDSRLHMVTYLHVCTRRKGTPAYPSGRQKNKTKFLSLSDFTANRSLSLSEASLIILKNFPHTLAVT